MKNGTTILEIRKIVADELTSLGFGKEAAVALKKLAVQPKTFNMGVKFRDDDLRYPPSSVGKVKFRNKPGSRRGK